MSSSSSSPGPGAQLSVWESAGSLPRLRDIAAAFLFTERVYQRHAQGHTCTGGHTRTHTLIQQASHTCGSSQIQAQTFYLPDTLSQTWGPLLDRWSSLTFASGYTCKPHAHPILGKITDTGPQQPTPSTWVVTLGPSPDAGAEPLICLTHPGPPSSWFWEYALFLPQWLEVKDPHWLQ